MDYGRYKLFIIGLLVSTVINAQDLTPDSSTFSNRMIYGGNLGLSISDNFTQFIISPEAGYMLTPQWRAGLGVSYEYFKEQNLGSIYRTNVYGTRVFTGYDLVNLEKIIPSLIATHINLHAEYQYLYYENQLHNRIENNRKFGGQSIHNVYVGGGLRQYFSPKSSAAVLILWNLNYKDYLPEANPIIRVGISF